MGKRYGVLSNKTSPQFSRFDPKKNLILVFLEKDRKRRFLVPTHTAVGKACMKVLKDRVNDGAIKQEEMAKPDVPEGFTQNDVAEIDKKRFCMLPKELKTYKARLLLWGKKNKALDRAKSIIDQNDLDAARDFIEERGDLPFERYKFQTLEELE